MKTLWLELLRSFRRGPFVCLVIVFTVAAGVTINTATLSLTKAMLYEPLPFPQLDRLVQMQAVQVGRDHTNPNNQVTGESWLNHLDYRAGLTAFEHHGLYWSQGFAWKTDGEPRQLAGAGVNDDYFAALGIAPRLGRLPSAEEINARAKVAVISHALWRREFASDPGVLGRALVLNEASYEIVGVLPPRASLPLLADVWVPLDPVGMHTLRSYKAVSFVGRLRPGVTIEQAQQELAAVADRLAVDHPLQNRDWRPWLYSLVGQQLGGNERTAITLQIAALLLLTMATFNMGALIYAQAAQRSTETAVRLALGASPRRLVRLAVGETLALVLPGIAIGLTAAWLIVPFLSELSPNASLTYFLSELTVRPGVAGASAAIALALGALAALLPASQHLNVNVALAMRESTRGGGLSPRVLRLQRLLVQGQLGITAILLTGATLLGLSYYRLLTADQGFRTDGRFAATFSLPQSRYAEPARAHQLAREIQERIRRIPGFHAAAVSSNLPVGDSNWVSAFGALPRDAAEQKFDATQYARVTEDYLPTLGLRLLQGRNFTADDRAGTQLVVIISESLARRLWPDRDAVGEMLIRRRDTELTRMLVVGVVADLKIGGARSAPSPFVLIPFSQTLPAFNLTLVAHSAAGEGPTIEALKQAVWASDPGIPVVSSGSLAERIDATAAVEGFQTRVLVTLGALALVITLMGISGLVLRVVTAREVEFSVRQALGATPGAIVRMLVVEQLRLVLAGVGAGTLLAWVLAHNVELPLFGISSNSPLPYALTIVAMGAFSLVSLAWPIVRAARTQPARMLRA